MKYAQKCLSLCVSVVLLVCCCTVGVSAAKQIVYLDGYDFEQDLRVVECASADEGQLSIRSGNLEKKGVVSYSEYAWDVAPVYSADAPVTVTLTAGEQVGSEDEVGMGIVMLGVDTMSYDEASHTYSLKKEDAFRFDGMVGAIDEAGWHKISLKEYDPSAWDEMPYYYKGATLTISEPGIYHVYARYEALAGICEAYLWVNGEQQEEDVASFADVSESAYYSDAVKWAVEQGITTGTTTTAFAPHKTCTRAQILTFLWRAKGKPAPTIANPFSDVTKVNYYYDAALWAYEKGIISGTTLAANTPCSRSSAVTYLWKMAGSPNVGRSRFTDVASRAEYAQAVEWAVQQGITTGKTATTFSPHDTCTRAQIVTFLYRALHH